ncbi:hypothetical protein [Halobacillus sp. BBL2006]|uniref:hypothetical protein n=1 Tax=Halobacillus sp. BBL2006 TaxID=1543706 RepID=UPI00054249FA|nr:hypothetical protein [Halobacillus sp. BBL2006]KHE67072.1 hypothetical protein LD39_19435 [Halobacillus sp. BBL2006]
MWSTISILAAAAGIFLLEFPKLKRAKKKKDMWYFSILLFIMTSIGVLESRGVNLPNPLDYIQSFYRMIHSWFGL